MRCAMVRWGPIALLALAALPQRIRGQLVPSNLKVGTCDSDAVPWVLSTSDGVLTGFEPLLWNEVYRRLSEKVNQGSDATLKALVGTEPPVVQRMQIADLKAKLLSGDLDIAFCGLVISSAEAMYFDYTSSYWMRPLQPVILNKGRDITGLDVIVTAFGPPDPWAIFSLLLLLILSLVFSHLLWALERLDNVQVHKSYGPGVFDSWWIAMVTALTVGYGDKVPITYSGKVISIAWMFAATYCVGMFGAAVTGNFLMRTSVDPLANIVALSELQDYKLGATSQVAFQLLKDTLPAQTTITLFDGTDSAMTSLEAKEVDVVLDDKWKINWLSHSREAWKEKFSLIVREEKARPVAMLLARPAGAQHSVSNHVTAALLDIQLGEDGQVWNRLTKEYFSTYTGSKLGRAAEISERLQEYNITYSLCLVAAVLVWAAGVLVHYRNEIRETRVRKGLLRAMKLGAKYSREEVMQGAKTLFKELDTDSSGTVSAFEILTFLQNLGQEVEMDDVLLLFEDETPPDLDSEREESGFFGGWIQESKRNLDLAVAHQGLTERQFDQLILKLALGHNDADSATELNAPVLRGHLEQALFQINSKIDHIDKRIGQKLKVIYTHQKSYLQGPRTAAESAGAGELGRVATATSMEGMGHAHWSGANSPSGQHGGVPSMDGDDHSGRGHARHPHHHHHHHHHPGHADEQSAPPDRDPYGRDAVRDGYHGGYGYQKPRRSRYAAYLPAGSTRRSAVHPYPDAPDQSWAVQRSRGADLHASASSLRSVAEVESRSGSICLVSNKVTYEHVVEMAGAHKDAPGAPPQAQAPALEGPDDAVKDASPAKDASSPGPLHEP